MTRSLLTVSLVAALALSLSACGAGKPAPQPTATCPSAAPVTTLPAPVGNPGPGQVRWSVLLDRCAGAARSAFSDIRSQEIGTVGPGNELILDLNGTISRFDLSTGARSWQRKVVAPAAASDFDRVEATSDLVLVTLTARSDDNKFTFLDARTGAPLGALGQDLGGLAELVGGHVVISAHGTVSGYDPRTGKTGWQVKYTRPPDDPYSNEVAHDDTTLYLEPPGGASGEIMRIDAATGHRLPPLRLPAAAGLTPSRIELFGAAQGRLVLDEYGTTRTSAPPGGTGVYQVVRGVAVDTRTGALAWSRPGQITIADSGPFTDYGDDGAYTAIDPRTGRPTWTIAGNALDTGPGRYNVEPLADHLVQAAEGGADLSEDPGRLLGVPPAGFAKAHPAWRSAALPRPQLVAADQRTAVVTTCDAWGNPVNPAGCADRELVGIALTQPQAGR
ncbi:PQQ-binding-like beta-propeller repeat protein [Actinoplanes sp. NPDC051411]|uniref:outer membrane protein assembly factor BamB family protein n=1 Tax=Actinoplanes sp. NPDC051411 TaxID=3155522 RepID=UPI00342EEF4A